METKALLAILILALIQQAESLQLTTSSVVGNLLLEQGTMYMFVLLLIIATLLL
jgi:hypothetical protein